MTQTRFELPRSMDSMDTDAPKAAVAVPAVAEVAMPAVAEVAVPAVAVVPATVRCHRNSSKRAFQCEQCETSWPSANALLSHQYTHSGEKPYECNECSKRFSQSCNLKSHIAAVHRQIKFQCMICWQFLSTATNLSKHIEKTHNHAAKVRCSECWMFMRGDLKRHQRTNLHERMVAIVQRKKKIIRKMELKIQQGILEKIGLVGMLDVLGQLADMRKQQLNIQVTTMLNEQIVDAGRRAVHILTARAAEGAAAEVNVTSLAAASADEASFAAATADECTHYSSQSPTSEEEASRSLAVTPN